MRRLDLKKITFRPPIYNVSFGQKTVSGYDENGKTYLGMPLVTKNGAEITDYGNVCEVIFRACFDSPVDIHIGDGVFFDVENTTTPLYIVSDVVSARGLTLISAKHAEANDISSNGTY